MLNLTLYSLFPVILSLTTCQDKLFECYQSSRIQRQILEISLPYVIKLVNTIFYLCVIVLSRLKFLLVLFYLIFSYVMGNLHQVINPNDSFISIFVFVIRCQDQDIYLHVFSILYLNIQMIFNNYPFSDTALHN